MAFDKVIDSTKLDTGMSATANAIRAKTGSRSPIEWDEDTGFKSAVEAISSGGGVELPELTEPAEPEEVFSGKEYIDGEGQKKTGSFSIDAELNEQDSLIAQIANALQDKAIGSLGSLPPLENRAEPGDIVSGKTLYDDNGKIVIGTMKTVESVELEPLDDGSGNVKFSQTATYNRYIPAWNSLTITSPLDKFGDAYPNDVRKGKTFTSAAGLLVEGTMETGGVHMSVDGETLVITGAVTIENETLIL